MREAELIEKCLPSPKMKPTLSDCSFRSLVNILIELSQLPLSCLGNDHFVHQYVEEECLYQKRINI